MDKVWVGWNVYCQEGPPPCSVRAMIAAIDAYFASLSPQEETDVDEDILEKLKALPSFGPVAKFDAEGKFGHN